MNRFFLTDCDASRNHFVSTKNTESSSFSYSMVQPFIQSLHCTTFHSVVVWYNLSFSRCMVQPFIQSLYCTTKFYLNDVVIKRSILDSTSKTSLMWMVIQKCTQFYLRCYLFTLLTFWLSHDYSLFSVLLI